MQLRQHVRYFINNAAFPRHGKISAASFEPLLSVKTFNETSPILASIPRPLCVANTPSLYTRGVGGVGLFIYGLLSNANGLVKPLFLCTLFKTLIRAPVFLPISLPPFNQVLTLILVHFFHPSFNLPTKQPPLPSQEVSEVREEKVEVPREELPCQGKVLLDPTIASPTKPTHTILHLTFSNNTNRRHKMFRAMRPYYQCPEMALPPPPYPGS